MELRALLVMWDWVTGIRIRLSFSIRLSGSVLLHPSIHGSELTHRLEWKWVGLFMMNSFY